MAISIDWRAEDFGLALICYDTQISRTSLNRGPKCSWYYICHMANHTKVSSKYRKKNSLAFSLNCAYTICLEWIHPQTCFKLQCFIFKADWHFPLQLFWKRSPQKTLYNFCSPMLSETLHSLHCEWASFYHVGFHPGRVKGLPRYLKLMPTVLCCRSKLTSCTAPQQTEELS